MLRLGGRTVALATSCSMELSLELYDAKTKDDIGAKDIGGDIAGNISSDALLGMNEGKDQQSFPTLYSLFREKQEVDFVFFVAAEAMGSLQERDWASDTAIDSSIFPTLAGKALITSLRLSGEVAGYAKYSVTLKVLSIL